jgi:hypothetical protein
MLFQKLSQSFREDEGKLSANFLCNRILKITCLLFVLFSWHGPNAAMQPEKRQPEKTNHAHQNLYSITKQKG